MHPGPTVSRIGRSGQGYLFTSPARAVLMPPRVSLLAVTMRRPELDSVGPLPDISGPGACTTARKAELSGWSPRRGD